MKKYIYKVHLKELLKLIKCLAFSDIHTIVKLLDLLFKALHQKKKKRNEIILTSLIWVP